MHISQLSSFGFRLKHAAIALLFIGTQIVFPLALSGTAHAAIVSSSVSSTGFVIKNTSQYSVVGGVPTGVGSFKNGNVGAYPEGACIPAVFQVTNNSGTTGDLFVTPVIDYLQVGTSQRGFTQLEGVTSTLTDSSTATNLNNLTYSGNPLSSTTSFQTTTGVSIPASVSTAYAGNDTSTTPISTSDTFRHYNITLTGVPNGATVNVLTCGRLGLDASQYNGSSLSMRTVQGGAENIPIPVNAILILPSITITKTITQGTALPSDFSFNVSPAVNGQSSYSIPVGQTSVTVPNVNPDGTYTVTESGPAGYRFTGGTGTSCTVNAGSIGTAAGQMTATVAAGNPTPTNATCNFTNTINTGSITIIKDAQPNSSQVFNYTTTGGLSTDTGGFTLSDPGTGSTNTQTFNNVVPGTYTVTESPTSGWDFKTLDCGTGTNVSVNGATATITLGNTGGQSVVCTYTNAERGTITVHKVTDPSMDPTPFTISASSSTGGTITETGPQTITTSQDVVYRVSQGTYAVSEDLTNTPGWSKDDSACANIVVSANSLNQTCTIYNTKLAKLKIVKTTDPASSSQFFTFTASGPSITQNNNAFTLDTDATATYPDNYQYSDLTPGSYSVNETEPANWQLTGLVCDGISYSWPGNTQTLSLSLLAGADVTCTYTNTQLTSISGYKYDVNSDKTVVGGLPNWSIQLFVKGQTTAVATTTTGSDGSFSFNGLLPGFYSLTETLLNGWTQIFSPSPVNLLAGTDSTGNNFGNFQNASISGYKFNDVNGNGQWDNGENGLAGWTITLYANDGTGQLSKSLGTTVTANDGSYSFGNLPPASYKLCETSQTGWSQTFPTTNNRCQLVTVALSGHDYSNTNFGNQGRGTISVIKNVDTNGDGTVDQTDVTTWNWDINGSGGYSTGSANHQSVAAGSYTVSEEQRANYHVTSSSCTGTTAPSSPTTSLSATVNPGDNVACTFTNTRDTGSLTLIKHVINSYGGTATASDFTMHVTQGGVDVAGSPAAGSETGIVYNGLATGTYAVSENTPMAGYHFISVVCDGSATNSVTVTYGVNKTCTITNGDLAAQLVVIKHVINDNGGTKTAPDFTMNVTGTNVSNSSFPGAESPGTTVILSAGPYSVGEGTHTGYAETLSSDCSGTIALGQTKTCTITNNDIAPILTVIKHVINDNGGTKTASDFTMNVSGTNVSNSSFPGSESPGTDVTLNAGNYSVDENAVTGYAKTLGTDCSGAIALGEHKTCTVTNNDIQPKLTITKVVNNVHGGNNVATDFPLFANTTSFTTGVQQGINAGSYTVSETNQPGYTQTGISGDCASNGSITLAPGDVKSCTITNTDIAPTLTIIKTPTNPYGTVAAPDFFGLQVDGKLVLSGVANTVTSNTPHTINEVGLTGYSFVSITGDAGCPSILGGSVTLTEGQNMTCTISNQADQPKLVVIKHVVNTNGGTKTSSDFTMNVTGNSQFVPAFQGADTPGTTVGLNEGSYAVSEGDHTGYSVSYSSDCNGSITIGQTKTCTVTNTAIAPQLTVIKRVVNNHGGTKSSSDFTMNVTGTNVSKTSFAGADTPGTTVTLDVGTFSVEESSHTGYTESKSGDCSGTISLGDHKTCTITNTDIAPTLTIIKYATNNYGTVAPPDFFGLQVDGKLVLSGVTNSVTSNTPHTINEVGLTGYSFDSITGDEGCPSVLGGSVTLAEGQNMTCTISNQADQPKLIVIKHVVNNHGGTKSSSDFTLNVTGNSQIVPSFPGADTPGTTVGLNEGPYAVSEGNHTGYSVSYSSDCNGSITIGQTKTCTITNSDIAPHLTVIKHVINDNSGTSVASDFSMNVDATNVSSPSFSGAEDPGTTVTLNAGDYNVYEGAHDGYNVSYSPDCYGTIDIGQSRTCYVTNNDISHPSIKVVKSGPTTAHEGDVVTYTFTVTNIGDTPLSNLTVEDNIAGTAVYQSGDTNNNGLLDLHETWIYTKNYTIPTPQTAAVVNTVTACGYDSMQQSSDGPIIEDLVSNQGQVCATDSHTLVVLHPAIKVVKTANMSSAKPGDTVTYSFTVTNTGDTPLSGLTVNDSILGKGVYQSGDLNANGLLDMTETWVYTASYLVPAVPANSTITNTVTACGLDVLQKNVCGTSQHNLLIQEVLVNTGANITALQYVLPVMLFAGVGVSRRYSNLHKANK